MPLKPIISMRFNEAWLFAAMAFGLCLPGVSMAQAQAVWPSRPIHLILPYAPGAGADAFARTISNQLRDALGQPIIIENRPGANGVIGSLQVAKAAPDGYTLLVTFSMHYALPFLQKAVPYDVVKDFTPIVAPAKLLTVLAVNPSNPAKTAGEFIAQAKSAPQGVQYGTGGLVLFGELLAQSAGLKMTHIPYKGGALMMNDLLGGQIDSGITFLSSALPQAKSGRLRVLAVLSDKRALAAPELPAITETVPTFMPQDNWVGILGPAGMPPPIVDRIYTEVRRIVDSPAMRERLSEIGFEITKPVLPADLATSAQHSYATFYRVLTQAGIKPE